MNWKPFFAVAKTPYNGHWRCCLLLASRNGDIPTTRVPRMKCSASGNSGSPQVLWLCGNPFA